MIYGKNTSEEKEWVDLTVSISLLGLPEHLPQAGQLKTTDLYSPSSGGWKSNIKVPTRVVPPLRAAGKRPSSSFLAPGAPVVTPVPPLWSHSLLPCLRLCACV